MKTFLIVAGLLMTGASVYGIVDYNQKAGKKEFKELYKDHSGTAKPVKVPANATVMEVKKIEVPQPETPAITKKEAAKKTAKKKTLNKEKRTFQLKEFSRGKLD